MENLTENEVHNMIDTSPAIRSINKKLARHDRNFKNIDNRFDHIEGNINYLIAKSEEAHRIFVTNDKFDTFKDEIYTKLDAMMGILQRWDDERLFMHRRIENHEERIVLIEGKK